MPFITFGSGPVKRAAIDRQRVANGDPDPIHVHYKGKSYPAKRVEFAGPVSLIYSDQPNANAGGARAYMETTDQVTLEVVEGINPWAV
jgi:hypothetical protein